MVADVLGQEHLHAAIEEVEEMLRTTYHIIIKSPREIHTYRPTSRWTRLPTCSKPYTTFLYSYRALLSNVWL